MKDNDGFMSDIDNRDKPKLGARAPLGLKRTVETGKVKQSFSHGRSNTVVVEVKRRRVLGRPGEAEPTPQPEPEVAKAPRPAAPAPAPAPVRKPAPDRPMTPLERREQQERLLREAEEARMAALEEARRRDEEAKQAASEEERRRAEENRRAEEDARQRAEAEAEQSAVQARQPAETPAPAAAPDAAARARRDRRGEAGDCRGRAAAAPLHAGAGRPPSRAAGASGAPGPRRRRPAPVRQADRHPRALRR